MCSHKLFFFFLLCINDLPQSLKNTKLFFSADGTEIFYQQKDIQEVGKKWIRNFPRTVMSLLTVNYQSIFGKSK